MNDDDVLTMIRDRFASARMSTATEAIMARGRSMRRRRHVGRLAAGGAVALAVGGGLSVPALTAATPGTPAQARLAAWTVSQRPDGSIAVTIRELRDLPALRARLAADGARATVGDTTLTLPDGCVAPESAAQMPSGMVSFGSSQPESGYAFTIRPSLIPAHQVLRILLLSPKLSHSTPPVTQDQNGTVTVHGGPVSGTAAPGEFVTLVYDSAWCAS